MWDRIGEDSVISRPSLGVHTQGPRSEPGTPPLTDPSAAPGPSGSPHCPEFSGMQSERWTPEDICLGPRMPNEWHRTLWGSLCVGEILCKGEIPALAWVSSP